MEKEEEEKMKMKKMISLLMMLLMMLMTAMPLSAYNGGLLPQPSPTPPPAGMGIPRLISPHNITLEAGESQEISITLRNVGTGVIRSLFTVASPSGNAPFSVEFLRNTNSISSINPNTQRTMTLRITVDEDAAPDNYSVRLEHFFRNEQNAIDAPQTSVETINVRIGGIAGTPDVRLGNFETVPTGTLSSNQIFTVKATIENIGDATARNVRVALPENSHPIDDSVFITNADELNQAVFAAMGAEHSELLSFTFQTAEDIKTGLYPIEFHVSFADEDGKRTTEEFRFIVNVNAPENDDALPILEIRDMNVPVGRITVGQTGRISFYLYNSGEVEARNIRVTAISDNETEVLPMPANIQVIPRLAAGESRAVSFNFSPTQNAGTKSYIVRFRTDFELGRAGEPMSFVQPAALNVYNPEEEDDTRGTQIPRVIVANHSVNPAIPRAGQEFEMEITFRNTNASVSVNNISITLEEVTGLVPQGQTAQFAGFLPVGGSDTIFVNSLAPLGEITRKLTYSTAMDATPGTHNMRVRFKYQDQNWKEQTAEQLITITIAQVTRLELANVNVAETASVGSPVWFNYQVINSGRVNLINVRIETDGPFDVNEAQGFRGNLSAQRTLEADGRFVPLEAGMHKGTFRVLAEDNTGALVEAEHSFNIMVTDGFGGEFGFEGGDWDGAWSSDVIGGGRFDGGFHVTEEGEDNTNAFVKFFRNIFTREAVPEGWNEEFMGEFDSERAAMMGFEVKRETRWGAVIGAGILLLLLVVIPIIAFIRKKSKLDFDED
jgi:hypothetical protein